MDEGLNAAVPNNFHDFSGRCVFLITSHDGGILFDLDNDEFLKLDPLAAEMWALLIDGETQAEVADSISLKFGVESRLVSDDLQNMLQTAAKQGITPKCVLHKRERESGISDTTLSTFPWYGQDPGAVRPTPRPFTVIRAFLALAMFDLVLSRRSLKLLCHLVNKWPVKRKGALRDPQLIGRVCTAVERACVWYPKKALCLQRSAVTSCLLKSAGISAKMVIAARIMPMLSHAWVEVDGSVVNDHPRVTCVYQPLTSF
jgi:hypothetical protein